MTPGELDSDTGAIPSALDIGSGLELPKDPKAALSALRSASMDAPVAVFKHSPICPISRAAQGRFFDWVAAEEADEGIVFAQIDVLAQKPLARGLVAELDIKHESPQVLLFHRGELQWHGSHGAITQDALEEEIAGLEESPAAAHD